MTEQIPIEEAWGVTRGRINSNTTELENAINEKMDQPTGTPDGTKFLRDDETWAEIPAGGDGTIVADTEDPTKAAKSVEADGITVGNVLPEATIPATIARTSALVDKANVVDVIERDNTEIYTPTAPYHPATKKYIDDQVIAQSGSDIDDTITVTTKTWSSDKIAVELSDKAEVSAIPDVSGKADATEVLTFTNTTPFVPDSDYEPTTKKYVDDKISAVSAATIDDAVTSTTSAWSSDKIGTELDLKANSDNVPTNAEFALKADKSNVIERDNTGAFTPTQDYHPATKKYIDDQVIAQTGTEIDDAIVSSSKTWSSEKVTAELATKPNSDDVYDKAATDALIPDISGKADAINVLQLNNTTPFAPDSDYEPTTKKYVDDKTDSIPVISDTETLTTKVWSSNKITSELADKSDSADVLELTNTTSFTPTADYHPSTKKYVDDSVSGVSGAEIDDNTTAVDKVWSSNKINIELSGKANTGDIPDITVKADKTNVLALDNTTAFVPDNPYEPATKKYVDDAPAAGVQIDDLTATDTETWSSNKITLELGDKLDTPAGITDGTKFAKDDGTWATPPDTISPIIADGTKAAEAVNADTVNNLTVETAVPAGAVFTDTINPITPDGTKAAVAVLADTLATDFVLSDSNIPDTIARDAELPDITGKADKIDTYTKVEVDGLIPTVPVTSVNTKTGAVVLDKTDIELDNVDNTSDADKEISTATQLALDAKEPLRGADDNYVTDAEKVVIGNTSGTNTGDQDLTGLVATGSDATLGAVTVDSIESPFVDGEALIDMGNNTISPTVSAGQYGLTILSGVLKYVNNGVLEDLEGGGAAIDDFAGDGDTTVAWSANKSFDELALKLDTSAIDDAATSGSDKLWSIDQIKAYISTINGHPLVEITIPASDGSWTNDASYNLFVGTASDDGSLTSVQWSTNGVDYSDVSLVDEDWTIGSVNLTEGLNTIYIKATDNNANSTEKTRTINLDTVAPIVTLGADTTYDGSDITFTVLDNMIDEDNIDTVTAQWDSGTIVDITDLIPYDATITGDTSNHTLYVTVTDLAGNETTDDIVYTYDTGVTYLIDEDFNDALSGWTESGTPTVSGGVLTIDSGDSVTSPAFTEQSDIWMRFIVTPTTAWPVGSARVVRFLTTGDVQLATFVIGYDGNMGVDVGGGSLRYTSSPYTLGVPIYVWVHYIEGTGSGDATVEGFFSLDGIKPDDPTVSEDASNLTGAAAKIDIREHQGAAATYDDLIVSATVLGDF